MPTSSLLNEALELLHAAIELDEAGNDRVEAATKYYQAIYLMERFLLKKDKADEDTRSLIREKVKHYSAIASALLADNNDVQSTTSSLSSLSMQTLNRRQAIPNSDYTSVPPPPPPTTALHPMASPQQRNNAQLQAEVGRGNQMLEQAIDLDEAGQTERAIEAYQQAAERFLYAFKLASSVNEHNAVAAFVKRRLESTMDRIEALKIAGSSASKSQSTQRTIVEKQRLAEGTKKPKQSAKSLSPEEVEILKNSSLIASGLFLPWSDDDADELLLQATGPTKLYTDPAGFLQLSDTQKDNFSRWARPSEIVKIRQTWGMTRQLQKPVIARAISPYTIKQKYVTDCSFVASLCNCANFERRFHKRLITSVLYPQNRNGDLIYNPFGRYMVKLWLNGVARCVEVDDYLPIDKHGNLLCSHSSDVRGPYLELWVCLIEKAFLKMAGGGYGFPGSNSGVDMFSLTGWIPETVIFAKDPNKVKDYETPPERAWERILSASSFGDCLITVSSDLQVTEEEADRIGVVTGHAYAVLRVMETSNKTRLLQLKNPWAHKGWKGRFSSRDSRSWSDPAFCREVGYNASEAAKKDDGIFWICWSDVLRYFQHFHLSWNRELFSRQTVIHGLWPKSQGPAQDTYNMGENPQYIVEVSNNAIQKNSSLWVLLSRHVAKEEQLEGKIDDYLTVHLYQNDEKKQRKWYPGRSGECLVMSAYTNSPHVLLRYDVEKSSDKYLSLVLSQFNKVRDIPYTLTVLSSEQFSVYRAPKDMELCSVASSSWTHKTAGGAVGLPTFGHNPMFAVHVPDECLIEIRVYCERTIAANAMLVPVQQYGDDIRRATGQPVLDSGRYRHGFAITGPQKVKPGAYVVIVSSFNQGQQGVFQLKVFSSQKIKLEEKR